MFEHEDIDGRRLIVSAQEKLISGNFNISHRTSIVFQNSVHIEFAFTIRLECVVMTVYQERCPGHEAWIHTDSFPGIDFDEHEAQPARAITFGFGFQLAQKALLKFENFFHVHIVDKRLGGSRGGIGEQDILEFVAARRKNGGTLIHFGRIEQIEDGEMLHSKHFVHAFQTEAALPVEKVGNVGLLESGLLRQPESGQLTCFDTLREDLAKVILQDFELHGPEYSTGLIEGGKPEDFHSPCWSIQP